MAVLIDTHAHLDDEQFAGDLPAVLERACAAGVVQIVAVATTARIERRLHCPRVAAIRNIFATVGIHPNHAAEAAPTAWDEVVALAGERRKWSASARRAWTATGMTRHFRSRKTTLPATWT